MFHGHGGDSSEYEEEGMILVEDMEEEEDEDEEARALRMILPADEAKKAEGGGGSQSGGASEHTGGGKDSRKDLASSGKDSGKDLASSGNGSYGKFCFSCGRGGDGRGGGPDGGGNDFEARHNSLMSYCLTVRTTLQKEKLQDKFEPGDKDTIENAVKATLNWLEQIERGEGSNSIDAFERKQKLLEGVVNPIVMKVIVKLPYRSW